MCFWRLKQRLDSYLATRTNRLWRLVLLPFMDRPTSKQPTPLGKPLLPLAMWYNWDSNRMMTFSNLPELEHLAAEGYYAISPREVICIGCNEKCKVIRMCHTTVVDH
jgi:hypothetical protein